MVSLLGSGLGLGAFDAAQGAGRDVSAVTWCFATAIFQLDLDLAWVFFLFFLVSLFECLTL